MSDLAVQIVNMDIRLDMLANAKHANMVRDVRSIPVGTGLVIDAIKTIRKFDDNDAAFDAAKAARKTYDEKQL